MAGFANDLAPLALGIAASPFPIIPVILLLHSQRPRAASAAFLVAWVIGVAVPTAVSTVLADVIEPSQDSRSWVAWVRLALGVAVLGLGIAKWHGRRQADPPGWLSSIEQSTPVGAARLALILSAANPKILLFAAAAGVTIGGAAMSTATTVLTIVAFTAVASVTVALPVLGYVVVGERVLGPLGVARDWLMRHSAAIMAVVIVAIGLMLIAEGVRGL